MLPTRNISLVLCLIGLMAAVAGAAVVMWNRSVLGALPPLHASCKIDWSFKSTCDDINKAVSEQMKKWESADNCQSGGEKCLYKLISQTAEEITGTHETPTKHYVDDLTFSFKQDADICRVHGYSTSETWYAVLDYGTNYCNLHNLITGSGLDKMSGYSEATSDSVCTQYSSANCEVY